MIKQYEKDGKILFKAYVRPRSKDAYGVRLYRQVKDIESREKAEKIERKLLQEVSIDIARREQQGILWCHLIERYSDALYSGTTGGRPVQRTTAEDMTLVLGKYTREWARRPAATITRTDVIELFRRMEAEGRSAARKKALKTAINGAFAYGIDGRLVLGVTDSPAKGVCAEYKVEKKPEVLNQGEVRQLLEIAAVTANPWYPVWAMALLSGMRSGELIALCWSNIDWENRVITVEQSYNGRTKKVKSTKSGHWRQVPINDDLLALLKRLRAEAQGQKEVLPRLPDWLAGRAASQLRAFLTSIGMKPVKFHALRASFATMLLRNGIPSVQVMKICGWKDLKTMQHYVGLAGVEISGSTDTLHILPPAAAMEKVVRITGN